MRPRVLVLADRHPVDMTHGRDLRVYHLLREISAYFSCMLVDFAKETDRSSAADAILDFLAAYRRLPPRPHGGMHPFRFIRLSDANFSRRAFPDYYSRLASLLREIAADWTPDLVLNFSDFAAELGALLGAPAVLDPGDSVSLNASRALSGGHRISGPAGRLKLSMRRFRAIGRERALMNLYPAITTITPEERAHFLAVANPLQPDIVVVPNGVGEEAISGFSDRERGRSVVFWGNLDFPPNWTSVRYFYEQIFLPYLAEKNVSFEVIGRGGDSHLAAVFRDPRVIHHGFSEDLYALLSRQGAMVNPMVEGGGLKNKVLEAFACGIPVVSTPLGLDGIAARDGHHCLVANTPEAFSSKVLAILDSSHDWRRMATEARSLVLREYSWESAGKTLADCMFDVLSSCRPVSPAKGEEMRACQHSGNVAGGERSA